MFDTKIDPNALNFGPSRSPVLKNLDLGRPATSNPAMGSFDFDNLESIAGFGSGSTTPGAPGNGAPLDTSMGFFDRTLEDGTQVNGWGNMALGIGQGLMSGYLGMKQYGLAKDQLNQAKKEFQINYNNQTKLTNAELEDRQRARVASNPNAYRSVGEYMQQNGV